MLALVRRILPSAPTFTMAMPARMSLRIASSDVVDGAPASGSSVMVVFSAGSTAVTLTTTEETLASASWVTAAPEPNTVALRMSSSTVAPAATGVSAAPPLRVSRMRTGAGMPSRRAPRASASRPDSAM